MSPRWSSAENRAVNWISPEETEAANEREIASRLRLFPEPRNEEWPRIETKFDAERFQRELRGDS